MLFHILKVVVRHSLKFKSTFLINVIGLSTGLAASLLILLWIRDEQSVDRFHCDGDRIFQVMENQKTSAGIITQEATPIGLAYVLEQEFPEVQFAATATPNLWFPKFLISAGEMFVKREGRFVGSNYFSIFSFQLVYGNRDLVFRDIDAVAISESLAKTLFQTVENAAGKTLSWTVGDIQKECVVTAVFKDVPASSSEKFDLLLNIELLGQIMNFAKNDLTAPGPSTFVKLRPGADKSIFSEKVTELMASRAGKTNSEFFVTSYQDKYLYGKFENGIQTGSRIVYVRLFAIIGGIILLVACVNFMNLSTARAAMRMKEVGVGKSMGAFRGMLIRQYVGESMMISLFAMGLSVVFVVLLLPAFNAITAKRIVFDISFESIAFLVLLTGTAGILAGSYPAFYLSGFRPALVLKGKVVTSFSEVITRKGLVVFQFTTSVVFIIAVLVVSRQMSFVQNRDLGFRKDNVLYFEIEGNIAKNHHAFVETIKAIPGVAAVSAMVGNVIGSFGNPQDATADGKTIAMNRLRVDHGMIELLEIPLYAGRSFSAAFNDMDKVVINRAGADGMGLANPVGHKIIFGTQQFEIIGVTENFHYRSLHEEIAPVAFMLETSQLWNLFIRVVPETEQETISRLKKVYSELNPGYAFDYRFLDHGYQSQYEAEQRMGTLTIWFAVLSIVITCSGLFGLAAFSADRRAKEIGIRKTLGATSSSIMVMLLASFVKLVLIAITIALPVSFWLMRDWLTNFAYATDLNVWIFATGGLLALVVSILTIAGQAFKAARTEPAGLLRE